MYFSARTWVQLTVLFLIVASGAWAAADWLITLPPGLKPHYVGRAECARCHDTELRHWSGSDHDNAMDHATEATVRGDFNDAKFTHFGVTSTMFRRDGKFFINTEGADGKLQDFEIKYTFGWYPLQQYLVEFPDGRVQCLPIAWDIPGKRWFHLHPDEPIRPSDVLFWTKPLQNWNYMCAECHSTDLRKNYDVKTNSYHTTWSEIDVSCETCHGPGSTHVQLADSWSLFWDRRYGYGLPNLKSEDSHVEIETCAPCHARRRVVYPDWAGGDPLFDYFVPELMDTELYYADGQILEEDYEYGSFTQSKMYHRGVRCSNCHDPHTGEIKFREPGQPRGIVTNNKLCGQCHTPSIYDTPQHHHHPDSTQPGHLCVECHMPITNYMVVDPRRDHSLRIPRPELTITLGIPNACNGCHHDEAKGETPRWAEETVRKWYGRKEEPPHFAYAIAAGRAERPEGEKLLEAVTRRQDLSAMVRASAISLLGRYPTETVVDAARRGLRDSEPLVRVTSVRALAGLPRDDRLRDLTESLHDPLRAVRTEAARVLSDVPLERFAPLDRVAMEEAMQEYLKGLDYLDDQAAAHLNRAVLYVNQGKLTQAELEYETALRIDPEFLPARMNLAILYNQLGKKSEAIEQFREAVKLAERQRSLAAERLAAADQLKQKLETLSPESSEAGRVQAELDLALARRREVEEMDTLIGQSYYSIGLVLAEDPQRFQESAENLEKAARLLPDEARVQYNFGLALQHLNRPADAESQLKKAYQLAPAVNDYLKALAILYAQTGRWKQSLACADELVRREPGNGEYLMMQRDLRQRSEAAEQAPPPDANRPAP